MEAENHFHVEMSTRKAGRPGDLDGILANVLATISSMEVLVKHFNGSILQIQGSEVASMEVKRFHGNLVEVDGQAVMLAFISD